MWSRENPEALDGDGVLEVPSTATKVHMLLIKYIGRDLRDSARGECTGWTLYVV